MAMQLKTVTQYSKHLERFMTYQVFGNSGKPLIAFPTSEAHYGQWQEFGMVEELKPLIKDGVIQLFTVDAIDEETFFSKNANRAKRLQKHEAYMSYITTEFIPLIASATKQELILTGCSMGAFHAANTFFRKPKHIEGVIALSGVYATKHFLHGQEPLPEDYHNSVLEYLKNTIDAERMKSYRNAKLVFCTGAGLGEEEMLGDILALEELLKTLQIPAWIDNWGQEVGHDWPWWKLQLLHFLPHFLED